LEKEIKKNPGPYSIDEIGKVLDNEKF